MLRIMSRSPLSDAGLIQLTALQQLSCLGLELAGCSLSSRLKGQLLRSCRDSTTLQGSSYQVLTNTVSCND